MMYLFSIVMWFGLVCYFWGELKKPQKKEEDDKPWDDSLW